MLLASYVKRAEPPSPDVLRSPPPLSASPLVHRVGPRSCSGPPNALCAAAAGAWSRGLPPRTHPRARRSLRTSSRRKPGRWGGFEGERKPGRWVDWVWGRCCFGWVPLPAWQTVRGWTGSRCCHGSQSLLNEAISQAQCPIAAVLQLMLLCCFSALCCPVVGAASPSPQAIVAAPEIAKEYGQQLVETEHLLKALLEQPNGLARCGEVWGG